MGKKLEYSALTPLLTKRIKALQKVRGLKSYSEALRLAVGEGLDSLEVKRRR